MPNPAGHTVPHVPQLRGSVKKSAGLLLNVLEQDTQVDDVVAPTAMLYVAAGQVVQLVCPVYGL